MFYLKIEQFIKRNITISLHYQKVQITRQGLKYETFSKLQFRFRQQAWKFIQRLLRKRNDVKVKIEKLSSL